MEEPSKVLRFVWKETTYEFACLPFGLASAISQPISGASPSRWLKDIISRAGIDTSIFKAHSVRGAYASAAYERGASLQDI